ncbi:3-hydroxyanthranilic acid dioxygenase [Gorgonomyces haynaldii]|nr:3-hydroxyanthranilic acid dioxygenase [Gorgonomyces haynaldii]
MIKVNLWKWIEENKDKLQPPVNNYCLWDEKDFTVMIVGGPNKRTDYHVNPTEEWFYQVKGDMLLKTVQNGKFVDVEINEGEMFLLPGNVPHNPCRFEDTVGIVLERKRPEGSLDSLQWYCDGCQEIVYKESFYCTNLGTQLKPVIEKWAQDPSIRKCKKCGHENPHK